MTLARSLVLVGSLALLAACKEDLCKQDAAAFELELTLAGGAPPGIASIRVDVTVPGASKSASFDAAPLLASGRATVRVNLGSLGAQGFQAQVKVAALSKSGAVLAEAERTFTGSGDACNFFSLVLSGSKVDGGSDADARPDLPRDLPATPDLKPDSTPSCSTDQIFCAGACVSKNDPQHCGSCGNVCGSTCVNGLCEVAIAGSLSGLQSHAGKRVVVGNVQVNAYLSGAADQCGAGATGCLKIVAAEIVVNGTIDAVGAGFGGGGGGGGGAGFSGDPTPQPAPWQKCQDSKAGSQGKGTGGGSDGLAGSQPTTGSVGGAGGKGGGPWGGAGGAATTSTMNDGVKAGAVGRPGGYGAGETNGDTSTDDSIWIGSAGGGGSGGASAFEGMTNSVGGSGGGGAGNRGGGAILLVATGSITMAGKLLADGRAASTGNGGAGTDGKYASVQCDLSGTGGAGGNATDTGTSAGGAGVAGYHGGSVYDACVDRQCDASGSKSQVGASGGAGGPGGGGGILLKAPSLQVTGTISAKGGSGTANGGTVKLLYQIGSTPATSGVSAHHTVVKTY